MTDYIRFVPYLLKRDGEVIAVRSFPAPVPDKAVPLAMHALDADSAQPFGTVDLPPGGTMMEFDYAGEARTLVATWRVTAEGTVVHEFEGVAS